MESRFKETVWNGLHFALNNFLSNNLKSLYKKEDFDFLLAVFTTTPVMTKSGESTTNEMISATHFFIWMSSVRIKTLIGVFINTINAIITLSKLKKLVFLFYKTQNIEYQIHCEKNVHSP